LKVEAKLNHSQILAKYLINFTPNCFVQVAVVDSAELVNNIAGKSAKYFSFCTFSSLELNSAQAGQFCAHTIAESWHPNPKT